MKSIRIQSDGNGNTTVVTDGNGNVIPNIYSAEVTLATNQNNLVTLVAIGATTDIHADLHGIEFKCPCCEAVINHRCEE